MKIKFYIPKVDDSNEMFDTSFLMRSTVKRRYLLNKRGEAVIKCPSINIGSKVAKKTDPVNESIADSIDKLILPRKNRHRYYNRRDSSTFEKWTVFITFKYIDGESMLWIQKNNTTYTLNSVRMGKKDLCRAMAKIFYKSCFTDDVEMMDGYIDKCVNYPVNILYVLENRTPYVFYDDGLKIDVRINTKLIDIDKAALEISEGIWAEISIKDLNTFINTFALGSSRSKKWHRITPLKLWTTLMGSSPSDSQLKLMIAWLKQNRTQDMIEDRAKSLLFDLEKEYEAMQVVEHEGYMALFVRGKEADWIIADAERGWKEHHQKVNTYYWDNKNWCGPICIDNIHSNSTIGDQLASRGMMLLNDSSAAKMIYTLRGLPPIDDKWRGKCRFNRTKLIPYKGKEDQ
jgi:hypothetical protein